MNNKIKQEQITPFYEFDRCIFRIVKEESENNYVLYEYDKIWNSEYVKEAGASEIIIDYLQSSINAYTENMQNDFIKYNDKILNVYNNLIVIYNNLINDLKNHI